MTYEGITLARLSDEIAGLVDGAAARAVSVFARRGRPSNGFAIDDHLIVTPAHAVERPADVVVRLPDGSRREAVVAGRDDVVNLAVLRVPGLEAGAVRLARARPGQLLVALARHPTGGPIAALTMVQSVGGTARGWRGQTHDEVIRIDRTLPPAFAGAALIEAGGALVAMALAGEFRVAGLAVPAGGIADGARAIDRDGSIARGYLGVMCQAVALAAPQREAAGRDTGLLVLGLADGGAAATAGLLPGDLIVAFDDDPIADAGALHDRLTRERAATAHRVSLLRGATPLSLEVTLGAREARG